MNSENGSKIALNVYDVLGNKVATLVNGVKPSGVHQVEFDGTKLTSGVYFYELETDNIRILKKLILLK